ncbi:hypothetical protein VTN77DRAFT_3081 [Rasamsonia byssochlamydoides]|uniref:uncharacterized protein n=1 Tax=Rasamsonia byssochlamydoides TaxID=89139 RepID=UPI0037441DDB
MDSSAVAVSQTPSFSQQGTIDWTQLSRSTFTLSLEVLSRLSRAGVEPLTVATGQLIYSPFPLPPDAQQRLSTAIGRLKSVIIWRCSLVRIQSQASGPILGRVRARSGLCCSLWLPISFLRPPLLCSGPAGNDQVAGSSLRAYAVYPAMVRISQCLFGNPFTVGIPKHGGRLLSTVVRPWRRET